MRISAKHQNIQILPGKLLFSILRSTPTSSRDVFYFTIDSDPAFQYHPLVEDFGPPALPQLYHFVLHVNQILESHPSMYVHFYTTPDPHSKSNACVYIAFFRMIHLNLSADDAYRPIFPLTGTLHDFRDASRLPPIFLLSVLDTLRGIGRAIEQGWFDFASFDAENWRQMELLKHGAMDWIIPGKLLAFASPYSMPELPNGIRVATAADLLPIFRVLGITHVVRLNTQFYDAAVFREAGFAHTELFFPDGEAPTEGVLAAFLAIMDGDDAVALHCKAGIGRTFA
jgi:cell division cycle 14